MAVKKYNSKTDLLYFMHILKTGGTTFANILDNMFDYDQIYIEIFWKNLIKNIPEDFLKFKFFRGHFGYGLHKILPSFPFYITLLRDPIERTISHYEHLRRFYKISENSILKDENEDILDILKDPHRRGTLSNVQTRAIASDLDIKYLIKSLNEKDSREKMHSDVQTHTDTSDFQVRNMLKRLNEKDIQNFNIGNAIHPIIKNASGKDLLLLAKNRLSKFEFVGITEKLDKSLQLFYYTMNIWPMKQEAAKLNVSQKKLKFEEIPEETKERIISCNKLDKEIYEFGKNLFETRYLGMLDYLNKKYTSQKNGESVQSVLDLLERYHDDNIGSEFRIFDEIKIDFSKKIIGMGWQDRENNSSFRWSGPDTTSIIYLPLTKDQDFTLTCNVRALTSDILKSLVLTVNECLIDLPQFKGTKGKIHTILPSSIINNNKSMTSIKFSVDKTTRPCDVNTSINDKRKLGIMISDFSIKATRHL